MLLSEKIKELCFKNHISVRRLEHDCGFANGYVSRLTDTMATDRAVKVAEYFNLPLDYFFPTTATTEVVTATTKKEPSKEESPLLAELMKKWDSLTEMEQMELISCAGYIQSKHKDN